MAATRTVAQPAALRKSAESANRQQNTVENRSTPIKPRHGVVTLYGYGIGIRVERGHLVLDDGIGSERFHGRFSRVGHSIERLVTVGNDGSISLAALRWLADQKAAFVMLDRSGTVLAVTGPVSPSDARLRRAQASADPLGAGLQIAQELIRLKLVGQESIARNGLGNSTVADAIAEFRTGLASTITIDAVRVCEARAAAAYWSAWQSVRVQFPKKDLLRVPDHWLQFESRTSPISGHSPRLAANPLNAILNYLYAILESEARLAIAARERLRWRERVVRHNHRQSERGYPNHRS